MFAKAQASKIQKLFPKQILWTLCVFGCCLDWEIECSCWKAVELLQLSWASKAELNFLSWVELLQLSWAFSAELNLTSTGVHGKFNQGFFPRPLWSKPVELALGEVQQVSGSADQSDLQSASLTAWLTIRLTTRQLKRPWGRFNWPYIEKFSPTASFGAPPIYTHSYLSPTQEHTLNSISNLRNTSHHLSHISCLSHFKSSESTPWVRLRAACFVLHLQILLALLDSSFGTTSSSLGIHSWSF